MQKLLEQKMEEKQMKEKVKNQKAITLIALVVTIVVLLILAGITINMVFSNNGVIKQAQEAKNVQENAQAKDQEAVTNLVEQVNNIVPPYSPVTISYPLDGSIFDFWDKPSTSIQCVATGGNGKITWTIKLHRNECTTDKSLNWNTIPSSRLGEDGHTIDSVELSGSGMPTSIWISASDGITSDEVFINHARTIKFEGETYYVGHYKASIGSCIEGLETSRFPRILPR